MFSIDSLHPYGVVDTIAVVSVEHQAALAPAQASCSLSSGTCRQMLVSASPATDLQAGCIRHCT